MTVRDDDSRPGDDLELRPREGASEAGRDREPVEMPDADPAAEPEPPGPRHPRLRRGARWGCALLVLLLVGLGGLLWFALGTDAGARWLFSRLGGIMPGELEVAELQGPIRGPLTVRGLRYANDSMEVTIDRVFLDWRLRELLSQRLDIHRLEAEGVDILTLPGPEEPEQSPLPDINLRYNIVLRDARVRDVTIRSGRVVETADGETQVLPEEGAEPFILDTIDLTTTARGGELDVDSLTVRSPLFDLDVAGTLRPQGAYDLDLEGEWTYRSPELPAFSGGGTLTGTLEELQVRQALSEPFDVRLDALLQDPLHELVFDARVEADGVRPRVIDPEWPAATLDARLTAGGTLDALSVQGIVEADTEEYGRLRADLDLERTGPEILLRDLLVTRPGEPTRLALRGTLRLPEAGNGAGADAPLSFELAAAWEDLAWPLTGEPTVSSREGQAEVAGTVEDYRLAATAAVAADALSTLGPLGVWSVEGEGDPESFRMASLAGDLLEGELTGSGRVRWSPRVEWQLDLSGRGVNPAVLAPDYPGSLAFEAATRGHLEPGADGESVPVGRVELARLDGTLREQPLSARGTAELGPGAGGGAVGGLEIRLDPAEVTWARNRVTASGLLGDRYDLTYRLDAPNLGVVMPELSGQLTAEGTAEGPADALRVALTAQGEALRYGERTAGRLDLTADVDLGADGPLDLSLDATAVDLGPVAADRLVFEGRGTRGEHTLSLDAFPDRDGPAAVELALQGGLEGLGGLGAEGDASAGAAATPRWQGRLTRLDVDVDRAQGLGLPASGDLPRLGTWSLEGPAELTASAEAATLDGFCWAGQGSLCADGAWRAGDGWNLDADLTDIPLALARSFLPPDVDITGDLDGTIEARADAAGRLAGTVRLTPGPGVLVYPAASEREQRIAYEQASLEAVAGADGVTADLGLVLAQEDGTALGTIEGHLELPDYNLTGAPEASQAIEGRLSADLADLSFLQALVDGVSGVAGRLDADLTLGGTRGSPEVRGQAVLEDGRLDLPEQGLELRELELSARGVGREPITLTGSARSGEGTLSLDGRVPLAPSPETPARLTVQGQRFEVMDTEEIQALASPDLTLTFDGSRAEVTGEVRIPEAEVEIAKRGEGGAVGTSRDVVYVEADGTETAAGGGIDLVARVRVVLGDEVEVDVLGLQAEPTGSLLVVERPGRPTTGTGELDLGDGTFQAYGQDLTIERGRLVFAGPLTDPGIDLRAYREADDGVIAGLEATGTLRQPEVTLWSDPPMAQADQLSYILLGRPMDQAGEGDGDLLANAAVALGVKGGNLLGERIAARYGLEEVRFEADDGLDQASLVLGKYLSPRLFVGYGIGLFDAVNTFRIRYLLSDKLTLEAETGDGTSADLLYTLERGEGARRRAPGGTIQEALDESPEVPAEDGAGEGGDGDPGRR